MILRQYLVAEVGDSTISSLTVDGTDFFCFIVEDKFQDIKVKGETRIPEGSYRIVKRYEGKHFDKYSKKFGHKHSFMLEDVPNFSWIMMHIGVDVYDTEGCLLTVKGVKPSKEGYTGIRGTSTRAYQELYDLLTDAFDRGEEVHIEINRVRIKEIENIVEVIKEVPVEVEKIVEKEVVVYRCFIWDLILKLIKPNK